MVADEWGGALPAVRAYADEVARAAEIAEIQGAAAVVADNLYAPAREQVAALSGDLLDLINRVSALGGTEAIGAVTELQRAFAEFEEKVRAGTAESEDAKRTQDALAAVMEVGGAAAESFANRLGILAGSLVSIASGAAAGRAEIEALINATNALNNIPAARAAGAIYRRTNRSTDYFIREQERLNSLTAEQIDL